MDGSVVRALVSHQCGPGSIPGLGVICGLSLMLVLVLAPRVSSPGTPVFPSAQKTNISKFQFDLKSVPNQCSALNTPAHLGAAQIRQLRSKQAFHTDT